MAILIFLFSLLLSHPTSWAEVRSHKLFRKRPVVEDTSKPSETQFDKIISRFSTSRFETLRREELRYQNELTDLVNGLVLENGGSIEHKTEAIKRALEQEKIVVRQKLKTVQEKIKNYIIESMNELGWRSSGMGTTLFIKGSEKIHIRFSHGEFEIQSLD